MPLLELVGVLGAVGRPAGDEVVPRDEAVAVRDLGRVEHHDGADRVEGVAPALELVGALEDRDARGRLARDEGHLLGGQGVVDRHRGRRRVHRAHVADACARSRLVAMIATVSPTCTPASTSAAATSRAVSRVCAQVRVRHDSPSATPCLSLYAGSSACAVAVSASASIRVRPATAASIRARSAWTASVSTSVIAGLLGVGRGCDGGHDPHARGGPVARSRRTCGSDPKASGARAGVRARGRAVRRTARSRPRPAARTGRGRRAMAASSASSTRWLRGM